jgi:hypothetical protein
MLPIAPHSVSVVDCVRARFGQCRRIASGHGSINVGAHCMRPARFGNFVGPIACSLDQKEDLWPTLTESVWTGACNAPLYEITKTSRYCRLIRQGGVDNG